MHDQEGVAAFVADKLHHWNWIPYLMGAGGSVFRDAPDDLMPTLDTPEAAESAEYYANLLVKYGPSGVLSYTVAVRSLDGAGSQRRGVKLLPTAGVPTSDGWARCVRRSWPPPWGTSGSGNGSFSAIGTPG